MLEAEFKRTYALEDHVPARIYVQCKALDENNRAYIVTVRLISSMDLWKALAIVGIAGK
jgi:hypothetical protein